jgi:hypothetical protein
VEPVRPIGRNWTPEVVLSRLVILCESDHCVIKLDPFIKFWPQERVIVTVVKQTGVNKNAVELILSIALMDKLEDVENWRKLEKRSDF